MKTYDRPNRSARRKKLNKGNLKARALEKDGDSFDENSVSKISSPSRTMWVFKTIMLVMAFANFWLWMNVSNELKSDFSPWLDPEEWIEQEGKFVNLEAKSTTVRGGGGFKVYHF